MLEGPSEVPAEGMRIRVIVKCTVGFADMG